MKAVIVNSKGKKELCEVPDLSARAGELIVKVKSAAICGTDLRIIHGISNQQGEAPDRILGHEFSGEIAQVGEGVYGFKKGMRVTLAPNIGCGICKSCISGNTHLCSEYQAIGIQLDGAFCEYVRIPEKAVLQGNVMLLEEGISFMEAALCEPLSCVFNGIQKCSITPGDVVLVMGAGPIGFMHAKMAKVLGAGRVLLYDPSASRVKLCKEIDDSLEVFSGNLDEVREYLKNNSLQKGVDVCITACPAPIAQSSALELMNMNGRVCFFGGLPKDKEKVLLNTNLIHYKELSIFGSTRSSLSQFAAMLGLITTGMLPVKEMITGIFALEDYEQAFAKAEKGDGIKTLFNLN